MVQFDGNDHNYFVRIALKCIVLSMCNILGGGNKIFHFTDLQMPVAQ